MNVWLITLYCDHYWTETWRRRNNVVMCVETVIPSSWSSSVLPYYILVPSLDLDPLGKADLVGHLFIWRNNDDDDDWKGKVGSGE